MKKENSTLLTHTFACPRFKVKYFEVRHMPVSSLINSKILISHRRGARVHLQESLKAKRVLHVEINICYSYPTLYVGDAARAHAILGRFTIERGWRARDVATFFHVAVTRPFTIRLTLRINLLYGVCFWCIFFNTINMALWRYMWWKQNGNRGRLYIYIYVDR